MALLAAAMAVGPELRWEGVERVRHTAAWPPDCASIEIAHTTTWPPEERWKGVSESAAIECHNFGPLLYYTRFQDRAALDATVKQHRQPHPYCVAGRELVGAPDYERGHFIELCERLGGRLSKPRGADFIPFLGEP